MEILMSITVGVLFMVGTYMILTKSILRVILGLMLMSHGAHLLLLVMADLKAGAPPLLGEDATAFSDPLPQALILTAIVISFGVTSFLLVLAYRTYKAHQTDDLEKLRGTADE
ncbi:multisubunit sodium/proton antiporter MrpC subunit [Salsuginibacillus halophilus]|uniref:Multisubunit sodium/proton antiporter MrpC subunit n=1 Tax=Salsuginibacillus halophilus TaxID=517424 RepID=A0A2P8HFQ4_9BACI|nr:Na(+)/H(+) antiporter subunit C [Salsuginibacillus halophilus]PSL45062.1 multisubunit sodium/proton antiporter MrpC subunit [Salsuginibacillus halophilus]